MDHKNNEGNDLLGLCNNENYIATDVWGKFYDSIKDLLTNKDIEQKERGELPFRVWQIFDAMVSFAKDGKGKEFLCAAGVITHYLGDACQPLHISYLHDGDPLQPVSRTCRSRSGRRSSRVTSVWRGH